MNIDNVEEIKKNLEKQHEFYLSYMEEFDTKDFREDINNFQKNHTKLIDYYLSMNIKVQSVYATGIFYTTQYNQNRCLKEFARFIIKEFCPQHLNTLNNTFDTLYSDAKYGNVSAEGQELFQKNINELCEIITKEKNK